MAAALLDQIIETYFVVMTCDGIERLAKGAARVSIAAEAKCLIASPSECREAKRSVGLYEQPVATAVVRSATGVKLLSSLLVR